MKEDLAEVGLTVFTLLAVLGLLALSFFVPRPIEGFTTYKGKINEKFLQRFESDSGSNTRYYLTIEAANGKRIQVSVSLPTYQQAQPGMTIEKTAIFAEPKLLTQSN